MTTPITWTTLGDNSIAMHEGYSMLVESGRVYDRWVIRKQGAVAAEDDSYDTPSAQRACERAVRELMERAK